MAKPVAKYWGSGMMLRIISTCGAGVTDCRRMCWYHDPVTRSRSQEEDAPERVHRTHMQQLYIEVPDKRTRQTGYSERNVPNAGTECENLRSSIDMRNVRPDINTDRGSLVSVHD